MLSSNGAVLTPENAHDLVEQTMSFDSPAAESDAPRTALVDMVIGDGSDATPLLALLQTLPAEIRLHSAIDSWRETAKRVSIDIGLPPADVVILLGRGARVASGGWAESIAKIAPDSVVAAALLDSDADQVANVVNQGASWIIPLPGPSDRIADQINRMLSAAAAGQAARRANAGHRRAYASLTPGELEVMDALLEGLANKQIAQKLSIGLRTVELRRSKIMRKMRSQNLPQLVSHILAARLSQGLIR